jgi:DNA-binding SARP family transcriptional activator
MQLEIKVLGGFRVSVDGRETVEQEWRRSRSMALVKLLALAPRHRLHREQVMDALWPDLPPDAAGGNLRKAVHFARRTLDRHEVIGGDAEYIALSPDSEFTIDAEVFETQAKSALLGGDAEACAQAAAAYGGELLPDDRYAEWAEAPRERLHQLQLQLLRRAGLWQRVVEINPTDEEAARILIEAALAAGNRDEAIRQFQRLRERLRTDMGLGPSAATVRLYEQAIKLETPQPTGIAEHVRGLVAWGTINLHSGEFEAARQKAEEARRLALAGDLAREVGEASALVGLVAHMQGQWQSLFRSEFITWVRRGESAAGNVFDGHLCLAEFCLCNAHGHAAVAQLASEMLTIAETADSVHGRALATLILGKAELFSGRLNEAEAFLTRSEQLHEEAGAPVGRAMALHRLAEVGLARGQRWRASRLLQKGLNIAKQTWLAPHLLIRYVALAVELATDVEHAAEAIRQGDRLLRDHTTCQPCSMGFRIASSIALAEAGETDQAARRIGEAERIAGMWQGGPWVASVWEARGVYRLAQGKREQASALFCEAASRFGELARARDQARCVARAEAAS